MARATSSQYYARGSTYAVAAFAVPKAPGLGHPRKPQIAAAIIEAKAARAAECIGLSGAANVDCTPTAISRSAVRAGG
jgi:hypothetical protein